MRTSLSINLQSDTTTTVSDRSLSLEQEILKDDVTLYDLRQMWNIAKAGKSARTYKPYEARIKISDESVSFSLRFYVWTFPFDLDYSLETTLGNISTETIISREREHSEVFQLSDTVEFNRPIKDLKYEWETPLIDKYGKVHPDQPITSVDGGVKINDPYFGSARLKYIEEGHYHTVDVTIPTVDDDGNDVIVEEINVTITASWRNSNDEVQTESLKMEIPDSVLSAFRMCSGRPTLICHDCPDRYVADIYYNDCNGDILDVNVKDLGQDGQWCASAGNAKASDGAL